MTYKYLSMSNDVTELQILQFNRENVIYFFSLSDLVLFAYGTPPAQY